MVLDDAGRRYPAREAVVRDEVRLPYAELDGGARRMAGKLRSLGVRPGDRVVLSIPNTEWFPIAYFGVLKAGAVAVPLNPGFTEREMDVCLGDTQPRAVLRSGGAELSLGVPGESARSGVPHPVSGGSSRSDMRWESSADLLREPPVRFETVARAPDDTAVILYTSGTSGQPRGVELTHSNLLANAFVARQMADRRAGHRVPQTRLVALPLFHAYGQTALMNAGILGGDRLVLVPRFDPGQVLRLMVEEQVTTFAGVPTMYRRLLDEALESGGDPRDFVPDLVICNAGGGPMPVGLAEAFEAAFGVPVYEGYGLTETSPTVTLPDVEMERKPGSVGPPVFGMEVRVVDEGGADLPPGDQGEVLVRGHGVMKGYHSRPGETAAVLRDGWLHTGDRGHLDADGHLFLRGRMDDLILRGGSNIQPQEVEDVLTEHPDVVEAAVVGVPHPELGEDVRGFVVLRKGASVTGDELIGWCRERMVRYRTPSSIIIRDSLPRSVTGKLLRYRLREEP
jgi:long-chain acyl-CoA synthetase